MPLVTRWPLLLAAAVELSLAGGSHSDYEARRTQVRTLHRVIDDFLSRTLCRLDSGKLCKRGRDGVSMDAGRLNEFSGSAGEWAISGHSGDSEELTSFLFNASFAIAPRRICEVGFNVGHSAATLLLAAGGNASYLGFDLSVLNPGVNEEFFDMLHAWIGNRHTMEMRWGDASETLQRHLDSPTARNDNCEFTFYDGPHDILSVLRLLPMLRRLALAAPKAAVVIDDVRCSGGLCAQSTLAWDFLAWTGHLREIRCTSARSRHATGEGALPDFGACLGEFRRGALRPGCSVFERRCVGKSIGLPPGSEREEEWLKCCLA